MNIRTFDARDVAPACRLTNHFIERTAIHFGMKPARDEEFAAMWDSGQKRYPWLAADLDGRFAGYAKAGAWREREAYGKTAEVGVYVDTQVQRRGVGRALYAELLRRLGESGFHAVTAGITLPNEPSVRLHEAMGFVHVGTFREVGRKFDQWHDVGFWALVFR